MKNSSEQVENTSSSQNDSQSNPVQLSTSEDAEDSPEVESLHRNKTWVLVKPPKERQENCWLQMGLQKEGVLSGR